MLSHLSDREAWLRVEYSNHDDFMLSLAYQEVMDRFPELLVQRQYIRKYFNREPTHVVLPRRLYAKYVGEDADGSFPGTLMRLPIVWSDAEVWGVFCALPRLVSDG